MKTYIYLIVVCAMTSFVFSCSSDSPTPTPAPIPNNPPPDGKVHYSSDIAPIINSRCTGCHGNPPGPGPMSLTTLDNVSDAILNRGLIDRISRAQGAPGMMPNGGTRLPQSDIDKIAKWQTDGFLQ